MPTPDWPRLGAQVRARRVQLGFKSRDRFADLAGVGSRTLGELERGLPVSDNTLYALEPVLDWEDGSIKAVLAGGSPILAAPHHGSKGNVTEKNSRPEGEVDQGPVGYDLNAEADGLTDEEIESVLAVVRAMKRAKGR